MTEERIIDKIRKLLNLANNGAATEGERDNALRMAYALIAKHNLDLEEIQRHGSEEGRTDTGEQFYGRPWATSVCHTVASLFFCEYYFCRTGIRDTLDHHFVGKVSNSFTATELSMFLVASIKREGWKRARDAEHGAEYRRSFCQGAAATLRRRAIARATLRKRADELRQTQENTGKSTGTSLVVADYYTQESNANNNWLATQGVKLKESTPREHSASNYDAYGQGKAYGSPLPLSASITNPTRRLT